MFKFHKTVDRVRRPSTTEFHPTPLAVRAAQDAIFISPYISNKQAKEISVTLRGENKANMMKQIVSIAEVIEKISISPEQTGLNDQATVFLHYKLNNWHWYITERVDGDRIDQAFGYVILATDRKRRLQFRNISIMDLISHGCELDLTFSPQAVSTIKQSYIVH
ncbi:hypothetical protein NP603_16230 [Methylomonas sp. SURF-1]|jgi:hypothetical protein|uniref:WYL domain-containing protein n=2 Tax=Methylomonas TaxID=416 RepID=A0ABT1TK47_9GAMM|nr:MULTISPECIES: hypothetical protein [unclassified Methylomonas]MCQ8105854.1 hypothetical protein [Methylomonas sp. SURF-2]MCQ8182670.1 hypothetical protein [Methylomonas sp. SURF-1]